MTFRTISRFEKDTFKIADAVNQLGQGRTNATGTVTLSTVNPTTPTTAATCASGSQVFLFQQTANAAAAYASCYTPSTDVTKGQFIIHHSSSSTTDRIFSWLVMG